MVKDHRWPTKAYSNESFLGSREARSLRIMSEYMEPESRFAEFQISDTIVFFGSARTLPGDEAKKALDIARASGEGLARAENDVFMSRFYEEARELARRLTEWSKGLEEGLRRFVVCTGGGPGIMEAANRGASEAKGINIGLNIAIPFEQEDNPYITRELSFEFNYFFMRKFWFLYLAKALVIFPGGFGTMDELFEAITLIQTRKLGKKLPIVLYGNEYWSEVVNFEAMAKYGTINAADIGLFRRIDTVDEAFSFITEELSKTALKEPGGQL